jgi:hypothetical protein
MVGEYLDAGGKVSDLQVWGNPTERYFQSKGSGMWGADELVRGGKDVLTELGRSIQKAGEAEAAAIFGGVPQISLLAGAGLGAVIASVLTIPGDTAQITQDQVDAALTQYQLEQSLEIQENMGNLEENVLGMVDNTNEFLIADTSKAYDLINGVISGAITDWRAGIGELVSDWLLHGATVYDSSIQTGQEDHGGVDQTLLGMLSRGLF